MPDVTPNAPTPDTTPEESETSSGWTLSRVVTIVAVALIAFIVVLFVLGLLMALGDASLWAPRVQLFRDIVTIIITVQGILIITGVAIFIIQVARFINLLRSEVQPIAEDTRSAVKTARTTTEFVSKQAVAPIVTIKAFLAGFGIFMRELLAIRRILRTPKSDDK